MLADEASPLPGESAKSRGSQRKIAILRFVLETKRSTLGSFAIVLPNAIFFNETPTSFLYR